MTRRFSTAAAILVLAGVYFCLGKFGLSLAFVNASASAVWPPAGMALAALLLWGYRLWPGVLLGAFLVNITTQGSWATSLGIAAGNTLEALLGAWLVNRFAQGSKAFERLGSTFRFVLLAATLSTTVSASFGVTSLCLGGYAQWEHYPAIWFTWWLGDFVGDLIIAPLIVIWAMPLRPQLKPRRMVELAGLLFTLLLLDKLIFLDGLPAAARNQFKYLSVLPLLWAAFRFGQHGAITSVFAVSAIALWGTWHGLGPFVTPDPNKSLLLLQVFIGTLTMMVLVLASVFLERKRAAAESEHLAAIVQFSSDAIIAKTLEGTITSWNEAATDLFGYLPEEMIGQSVLRLVPLERLAEEEQILARLKTGERLHHFETERLTKTGNRLAVSLTISPIKNGEGKIIGASKIIRDITERKRSEAALRESAERFRALTETLQQAKAQLADHAGQLEQQVAERTASLREALGELESFSYSVSHDLRAPLRAMQGFAQMLQEDHASQLDAQGLNYLERIARSATRLDGLILDVLNYSRVLRAPVPLSRVDADKLVRDIIETYPAWQSPRAEIRIEGSLPIVLAHEGFLTQCISNLLGNAVKFVAHGVQPRVRIWAEPVGPRHRLWFEDNGIGIAVEDQKRIFRMFERINSTSEYEGTGIGLAIVRKAVERMAGQMGVESKPGEGSRFWIELGQVVP